MKLEWPGGKRIAVAVTVMYETWSEGRAPKYSVQATSLKDDVVDHAGIRWVSYGGRVGVWRILRTLDRLGIPGTFFTNAACADLYPDSIEEIVRSGHGLAGHGYYQDQVLSYLDAEAQDALVRRSLDKLEDVGGVRPTGWLSPVLAFNPDTAGILCAAGCTWHADVTYDDLPHRIDTPNGPMAAVPFSDFTDNRVLKSSSMDLYDVLAGTFDFLYEHEPMSLLTVSLHCQFGGRPMVMAAFDKLMKHIMAHDGVWFASHAELADWAMVRDAADYTYRKRFPVEATREKMETAR